MFLDDRWDQVSDEEWMDFAKAWLAELASGSDQKTQEDWGGKVVAMNFTASPAAQWKFILAAMDVARTADERSHIAAGPVEHLLSKHGDAFIGHLEQLAADRGDWAEMTRGVWRHRISESVWERVLAIQNPKAG